MWRLSLILLAGSLGLATWVGYECGIFGWTDGIASEKPMSPSPAPQASAPGEKNADSALASLEKSLAKREKELVEREAEAAKRERDLADKQAIFGVEMARYEKVIQSLQKKVSELDALNNSKAEGFRQLYEKMDTKKVASLLEEIEPPLAGAILGGMKQAKAAEVMGKMSNAKVRLITEKFLIKRYTASSQNPLLDGAKKGQ